MEIKHNLNGKKLPVSTVEEKLRYRMYKSKKHWVFAPVVFLGVLGGMSLASPVALADEIVNVPETVKVASELTNPPSKVEEVVNEAANVVQQAPVSQNEVAPATAEVATPETKIDTVSEPTKVQKTEPKQEESTNSNVETPLNNNTTTTENKTDDGSVIVPDKDLEEAIKEAEKNGVVVNKDEDKVVKDHEQAEKDYAAQVKAIEEAIQKAKEEKAKHDADIQKIDEENKKIDEYNEQVKAHNKAEDERVAKEKAEAEKNKKKDGYLSEVEAQKLVFQSEKNSKMTVTSGNKKLTTNQVLNQAKKNTSSNYLLGKIENLAKNPAYNLKVGEKLVVEYTLNNSSYNNTKLGKVQYTYTLKQANVNSKDGLIFLLSDPTDTMYYVDYYTGSMMWNMGVVFYDANGKQVDVSDSLVSFASLNTMKADSGKMSHEYVQNFNGKYISINGSSIKQEGNKVYSKGANTFKTEGAKYDGSEWDYSGSPLEYYGAIAGKTGKTISFDFGSNESGYIWFSFNSKVKAPTITPQDYKTPKNPIKYPDAKLVSVTYNLNKYIPESPKTPEKTVSDIDEKKVIENLLNGVEEKFNYDVTHVVSKTYEEAYYKSYAMKDTIDNLLNFDGKYVVTNSSGTDVTNWFTVTTNGKTILFTLNDANNNANFYDNTYTYNFGVNIADKEAFVKKFAGRLTKFNNQATMVINGTEHKSNVVTTKLVIPTPQLDPTKTVSDSDEKKVIENLLNGVTESFTYDVNHVVPQADKEAFYDSYVMKDIINAALNFTGSQRVLNAQGTDVTNWFTVATNGKTITFTLLNQFNNANFYGNTYTYNFGVTIADKEKFVKEHAGRVTKFDNQAIVEINGTPHKSNVVTTTVVVPTPELDPIKTVSDIDEKKVIENLLNGVEENFNYDVTHKVPGADKEAFYKTYAVKDKIDDLLNFDGNYKVTNALGADVTDWFTVTTEGKTILFTLKDANNNANFYDDIYNYNFGVSVADKEAFVKKFAGRLTKFDNQAIVEINGTEHKSNVVTTKLVIPTPEIDPEKTVSDIDEKKVIENLLNGVEENFNYDVTHVVPNADKEAYYKTYVMKDTIDENLAFDGQYHIVNEAGEDVTSWFDITTDGQTILFTLKNSNNNADFYGHIYTYNFGVNVADKEAFVKKFAGRVTKFDNQAIVEINGAEHKSNVVTTKLVIPTPHNDPTKTVSDSDEKEVIENLLNGASENFHYTIKHVVPQADKEAFYKTFAIKDTVDEHLFFDGQYVVLNEAGEDVTSWFDITTDGQTILFTLKDASNADFYGHTYTFDFGVSIKNKEAFIKKYMGKTVQFDNIAKAIIDGVEHESNAVITKITIPEPVKPSEPQEPVKLVHVPKKNVPVKLTVETPQKTLPQTGETGNIKAGILGSVLSLFGLLGIAVNKRKKSEEN